MDSVSLLFDRFFSILSKFFTSATPPGVTDAHKALDEFESWVDKQTHPPDSNQVSQHTGAS